MTAAALRSRMRRLNQAEDESSSGELNLVPYLDIVTNIILFLFVTMSFSAALTAVPTRAEAHGSNDGKSDDLQLTLQISRAGFTIATRESVMHHQGPGAAIPTLPLVAGELDYRGLTRIMTDVKRSHPDSRAIQVNADADIPYEIVVEALDAVRGTSTAPLFPDAVLAADVTTR